MALAVAGLQVSRADFFSDRRNAIVDSETRALGSSSRKIRVASSASERLLAFLNFMYSRNARLLMRRTQSLPVSMCLCDVRNCNSCLVDWSSTK